MKRVLIGVLMTAMGFAVSAATSAEKAEKKADKAEQKAEKAEAKAEQKGGKGLGRQISLAEARARIDRAIANAKVMEVLTKGLSAADQKQFLADVNKAIGEMPGSAEEKSALFLNANSAAMRAAAPGNLQTMVAETFATVQPEALTVISERFAVDLFNRDAAGTDKLSDEQFSKVAADTMKVVNARTAETDAGAARSTFAIAMFVRASNNSIPDLSNTLVETLDNAEARDLAKNDLLPSALGTNGRTQSYEPLLAAADAGRQPDSNFALVIAGPQHPDSIFADLALKVSGGDQMMAIDIQTPVLDAVDNTLNVQIPTAGADVPGAQGAGGATAGGGGQEQGPQGENPRPTPVHPDPYPGQN